MDTIKKLAKHAIKIIIDGNGSPTQIMIILCKKPILILLEEWAPDDEKK